MEEKQVPFLAYEAALARAERQARLSLIVAIIAIVLLFAGNAIWLYAWMSYDYVTVDSVEVNGENGIANYIGRNGVICNGESESDPGTYTLETVWEDEGHAQP